MHLLLAIRRISKNDVNKKGLVSQGCLPVLVSLTESAYEDEQIGKKQMKWSVDTLKGCYTVCLSHVMLQGFNLLVTWKKHSYSFLKNLSM